MMELTKKEMKFISQSKKSSSVLFVLGILMIIIPIGIMFYIKTAPMERMEKIVPALVKMRTMVENDERNFESHKDKITNQREADLIEVNLGLKIGVLQQSYLGLSMMIVLFLKSCQWVGLILLLWAFDKRKMARIIKKLIIKKEGEQ